MDDESYLHVGVAGENFVICAYRRNVFCPKRYDTAPVALNVTEARKLVSELQAYIDAEAAREET
jgi:hypothetical protein